MAREAPKQSWIVILSHNPNQIQGHDNKDNNTDDETKDVEDNDKIHSIEDQNEPEEKLFENKNDKNIDAFDDNPDSNANSKEDGDLKKEAGAMQSLQMSCKDAIIRLVFVICLMIDDFRVFIRLYRLDRQL